MIMQSIALKINFNREKKNMLLKKCPNISINTSNDRCDLDLYNKINIDELKSKFYIETYIHNYNIID